MKQRWLPLAVAFGLSGCSLAPTYHTPSVETAPHYSEDSHWVMAQTALPDHDWWTLFGDTRLNRLERLAMQANQNISGTMARVDEARALARATEANLYPVITAGAQHSVNRMSDGKPLFPASVPRYYRDNVVGLDLSYEVDLWCRLRNAAHAQSALAEASADDLAGAELSIQAELASDYFSLRGTDAELALLRQLLADWQDNRRMTREMYDRGNANQTDLAQADYSLQNQQTQLADLQLARDQLEHAIALLCGQPSSSFHIAADATPQWAPATVPHPAAGLPSTLLQRRPDIASAERSVAAANAEIGVARAAFFPVFSLDAAAGFENVNAANLFTSPNRYWSFGPGASAILFNGGQLSALDDQAHAAWREAVANYRNAVLTAWRDVENGLASMHRLDSEAESTNGARRAADNALQQMQDRYAAGTASALDVLSARRQDVEARLAATGVHMRQLSASILLIKALGGGWQSPHPSAPAPRKTS